MRTESPIVVVKIGGSLFDLPDLAERLGDVAELKAGFRPVVIAGGGPFVDVLRRLDPVHRLGELRSHRLALRLLDATSHLLADVIENSRVVESLSELPLAWTSGTRPILSPRVELEDDEHSNPGRALPRNWSVTSDSIAARIAVVLNASALLFLKSAPPPPSLTLEDAVSLGRLDRHLLHLADDLPSLRYANLRDRPLRFATLATRF